MSTTKFAGGGDAVTTYLGAAFGLFLASLPSGAAAGHVASLQSRGRVLAQRLLASEAELRGLRALRREESRANARAAEVLAGRRSSWLAEADSLRSRLATAEAEAAALRSRTARLERDLAERDDLLEALLGNNRDHEAGGAHQHNASEEDEEGNGVSDSEDVEVDPIAAAGMTWQNLKYDPVESTYSTKHSIPRRESPWKLDLESFGIPAKLKLLEQELCNWEKVESGDMSRISSLMRKQAKRYQSLVGKIDDLCKRMQTSDPCDLSVNSEFRTQRQTEFLLEAFHLQHRATETRQRLNTLQTESTKSCFGDELTVEAKLSTRKALGVMRNNFKEIQRNLEIWLARILGDLEGMLAREGGSRMREYIFSPYASAQ